MDGRRPPGPATGAARGRADDRPGTGKLARRGPNAGDDPGMGRADAAWHRGGCRRRGGDGARVGRGRRRNGPADAKPEGGKTLLSPFSPLQ
ncbi:MAG: hypothetical protein JO284_15375 [Planctomycetaceae bacterium]|nr:hypothetical protein [Planctomycetaceae bacterium]